MEIMKLALVVIILNNNVLANLICNGDFQKDSPTQITPYVPLFRSTETYYRLYINQNIRCWYMKNTTEMLQLKRIYNPPTALTTVLDLVPSSANPVCQTLILESSKFYNLSFQLFSNQNSNGNITRVSINGLVALEVRAMGIYADLHEWVAFQAQTVRNQICFQHLQNTTSKGANLDNAVLVQILPTVQYQTVLIAKSFNRDSYTIVFQTDYFIPPELLQKFKQTIKVYIKNSPEINVTYDLGDDRSSAVKVYAYNVFQYYNQIVLELPQKIVNNSTIVYYQSQIEESPSASLALLSVTIKWTNAIGRSFLCSYFFFSLLGLWNLLLLYNFLFISTLPSYVYSSLVTFCHAFYSGSSLFEKIDILKQYLDSLGYIQEDESIKRLPQAINGKVWFGSLGFSSGFFSNNAQTFILLIFLVLKLWLFSMVNKLLARKVQVRKITFRHLLHIFFIEIISNSPQVLISAGSNFRKAFTDCFLSKASILLSISVIIIIAFIIFCDYLLAQNNKKQQTKLPNHQQLHFNRHLNHYFSEQFLYFFLLHFTIPLLVVEQHEQIFFLLIAGLLITRFVKFSKKRSLVSGFLYFKLFFINFGWILYHFVFLFLWIAGKTDIDATYSENQYYSTIVNMSGAYIIFFIISSAVVEIIDFIIGIPSRLIKPIFKTCKLMYCVQKIRITHAEKPDDNVNKKQSEIIEIKFEKSPTNSQRKKQREMFTMFHARKNKLLKQKVLKTQLNQEIRVYERKKSDKQGSIDNFSLVLQNKPLNRIKQTTFLKPLDLQRRRQMFQAQNRERLASKFRVNENHTQLHY